MTQRHVEDRDAYVDDEPRSGRAVVDEGAYRDVSHDDGGRFHGLWGIDLAGRVNTVLLALLLALEALLGLRFALLAFGANLANDFVDFVMDVSRPFVRPFEDAFANRTWDEGLIEVNTLLAMGVYFVAGLLVMMMVAALLPRMREGYGGHGHGGRHIEHHG